MYHWAVDMNTDDHYFTYSETRMQDFLGITKGKTSQQSAFLFKQKNIMQII